MIECPICKVMVPEEPTSLSDMPREAQCYREHSIKPECPYERVIGKARGGWVLEVFKPLPQEEADALREYLD